MRLQLLTATLLYAFTLTATSYYVSPTGSDANNGQSTSTPFQTLQKAADSTNPGDIVYIMNGTYSNTYSWEDVLQITRSGTAANPIVYTSLPGHSPKISFDGWHGIKLEGGVSYIEISGLEVEGNNANILLNDALNQPGGCNDPMGSPDGFYNGNGIASDGRNGGQNHHITIRNCRVHDCAGVGISAIHSDYITIENCEVYNNAWYAIYGTSGISFYQLSNFGNSSGVRNVIRNNRVYGNRMFVPWIDAPCAITDGNGIIIDDSRNTQNGSTNGAYTGRTLIENNIVYENGGRGIHVFESDNVDILNNTVVKNGQSDEISDGEITVIFADDVNVYNNILYAKTGEKINSVNGTNINYDYNLNYNSTDYDRQGSNSLSGQAPAFVDLNGHDFGLQSSSPAIDAGTAAAGTFSSTDILGTMRPTGAAPDMGAYESTAPLAVEYLDPLTADKTSEGVLLKWSTLREIDHDYFEILHATDGRDFQVIGKKMATAATGVKHYGFLHTSPTVGNNYYRIRPVDVEGTATLSRIVQVHFEPAVHVFPNPVKSQLFVRTQLAADYHYTLLNSHGQAVQSGALEANAINVTALPSGIYWLQLRTAQGAVLAGEKVMINR
ncbi:MAG: right-handed parallel beta-helix repeat-containing protein [Bacteroidota bacterium]